MKQSRIGLFHLCRRPTLTSPPRDHAGLHLISRCRYPESPIKPSVLEHFLNESDAERALTTTRKLAAHDLSEWAIVGGWAVEIHSILNRQQPFFRPLSDIDFVVPAFDGIPR